MATVKIRCPKSDCQKVLRYPVSELTSGKTGRCPACGTRISVACKTAPKPPAGPRADDEDDGGSYGLARETSLPYLLRREADGFRLTPEERADKKRLLAEKLAANPRQCPGCDGRLRPRSIICPHCGLNWKTGKPAPGPSLAEQLALGTTVLGPAAAIGAAGFVLDGEDAVDIGFTILEIVVTIAQNA